MTRPVARGLAWLYLVGGGLGLVAAITLTLEKIARLIDPSYVPSCSINPVLSCGSVMDSAQAAAFGFPNPVIGVAAFPVVVTFGAALLTGYAPPRWVWAGMQLGSLFGVGFVHWLIAQSLHHIHALCPYCIVVWIVTIAIFWYTTLHTLGGTRLGAAVRRVHSGVLALWYVVIVVLVLVEFRSYWSTLL
ncbi:vitamin K epoxide reductase family protein [Amycolatopsis rhabdoformis]|uniref:Vitamin K epoxide reductase family protein n=1 Tax=Amycolatopsis rhabdoformis TaxID=1448059 RepID=A0ABZ1ID08_9PSEU|nr:vitamin K epoxide reductase family protein [Amycolatopsis rhabdoformis]WSE32137.1 vitamin K epoxide reductase family protein [Amycolatopsis rhabdoformis]